MLDVKLEKIRFRPGQRLFSAGEPGDCLYLIEEGMVDLLVPVDDKTVELKLTSLGSGEAVGELSLMTHKPYNSTAKAKTFVTALRITESDYLAMEAELPGWAKIFMSILTNRLQSTEKNFYTAHAKSVINGFQLSRMEKELKLAQLVQNTLFPEPQGVYGDLQVSGMCISATECCGDWWYHCQIGKRVFVWLGDATGHGASAALVVSAVHSVASILEYNKDLTPSKALSILSHAVFKTSRGQISMTFFVGCYDIETGDFTYSRASHEAPIMFRETSGQYFREHMTLLDKVNGPHLGGEKDIVFKESSLKLEKGDYILVYSDGLANVSGPQHLHFGEKRLMNTFFKAIQEATSADAVTKYINEKIKEFRQSARLEDDATFFVLRRG